MKSITLIAVLFSTSAYAQATVNISAGASTSAPYGNLSIGYKSAEKLTVHTSVYFSDKAKLWSMQLGYNASLGERFNLQVSGGGGWFVHNGIKRQGIKPSKSFVPMISSHLEWVWGERGGLFIEAFSALKVHGIGIGFTARID